MQSSGEKRSTFENRTVLDKEKYNKVKNIVFNRDFVRSQKYKTEAETFGWSFVFQDFVSDELKSKVTQRIQVTVYYSLLQERKKLAHIYST